MLQQRSPESDLSCKNPRASGCLERGIHVNRGVHPVTLHCLKLQKLHVDTAVRRSLAATKAVNDSMRYSNLP
jgi:hypothetical protein